MMTLIANLNTFSISSHGCTTVMEVELIKCWSDLDKIEAELTTIFHSSFSLSKLEFRYSPWQYRGAL
jgi:hypothetical protein